MAEKPTAPEPEETASLPGQITQVNPLELMWEKHRVLILLIVGAFIIAIGLNYAFAYWKRQERDRIWGVFAQGSQMRGVYAPDGVPFMSPISNWAFVNQFHWRSKLGALGTDLESVSAGELEDIIVKLNGTPAAIWAEWLLACKQAAAGDDAAARTTIESLEGKNPDFAELRHRAYPPIYVPVPEDDEDSKDPDGKGAAKNADAKRPPEPPAGSLATALLDRATRDSKFREARKDLYEAPEPDAKPEVVFVTSEGEIRLRFYKDRAPKHVANFLKQCNLGWYKGMRFHKMTRKSRETSPSPFAPATVAELVFLGHPESKDEDRSKWDEVWNSESTVSHEASGVSHFPFMLAADRDLSKRDSDQKLIYFTANDAASDRDGRYVVFGRIVAGTEIVKKIVSGDFFSTAEETSGQGKPDLQVLVKEVKVIE